MSVFFFVYFFSVRKWFILLFWFLLWSFVGFVVFWVVLWWVIVVLGLCFVVLILVICGLWFVWLGFGRSWVCFVFFFLWRFYGRGVYRLVLFFFSWCFFWWGWVCGILFCLLFVVGLEWVCVLWVLLLWFDLCVWFVGLWCCWWADVIGLFLRFGEWSFCWWVLFV